MSELTPEEIVNELDRHIVGQDAAKRAVAIALRNRWRWKQLPEGVRREVTPRNILMIGPTGVGKTEITRRLAQVMQAPFVKVEATKYTEVGYYGRDVESIIRDQQSDYYAVLRQCDRAGDSTAFVEFSLRATKQALDETLVQVIAKPVTAADRLAVARDRFHISEFARKYYLSLFSGLSTATASRDLRQAVDEGQLQRSGQNAQTKYIFSRESE